MLISHRFLCHVSSSLKAYFPCLKKSNFYFRRLVGLCCLGAPIRLCLLWCLLLSQLSKHISLSLSYPVFMNVAHNTICYLPVRALHITYANLYMSIHCQFVMAAVDNCLSLSLWMPLLSYCTIIPLTVVPVLFALINHAAFKASACNCVLHISTFYEQYSIVSIIYYLSIYVTVRDANLILQYSILIVITC